MPAPKPNAALVAAVQLLKQDIAKLDVDQVLGRYRLGVRICAMMADTAVYGTNVLVYVRNELRTAGTRVNVLIRIARRFTGAQIKTLTNMRTPGGRAAVAWSHVRELARLKNWSDVLDCANATAVNSWGARELRLHVSRLVGRNRAGGFRRNKKYTFERMMDDLIGRCLTLTNQADGTWLDPTNGLLTLWRTRGIPSAGFDDAQVASEAVEAVDAALRCMKLMSSVVHGIQNDLLNGKPGRKGKVG